MIFQKTVFFFEYKNGILTNERRHSDLKMTLSLSFFVTLCYTIFKVGMKHDNVKNWKKKK